MGIAGYTDQPALSYANDIINKILARSNPWKWNAAKVTPFLTQPYQQDYPTNICARDFGWLQTCVALDVNSTSTPRAILPMTCVQAMLPTFLTNRPSKLTWLYNSVCQTGSWPGPDTTYIDPLVANGGGPSSNRLTASPAAGDVHPA
jgi:hypothetical protein